MKQITFDCVSKELVSPDLTSCSYGPQVSAVVKTYGQPVPISSLRFGVEGTINGEAYGFAYPPEGVRYTGIHSNKDTTELVRVKLSWRPDDEVTVRVFLDANGTSYEETFDFTAPRPSQPYPSWAWDETNRFWEVPVPYPEDENYYEWNENTLSWDLVTIPET